jgi:hypothetical protein
LAEDRRFLAEDHRFCALTSAIAVSEGNPADNTEDTKMKGAIGFFAIAVGTAAIAFPMTYKYIPASAGPAQTRSPQAANGLECHVEEYDNELTRLMVKTRHLQPIM